MARARNKPTQSWMERAKIEIEHEEELTLERAYELGKIRGKKETIEKACNVLCHTGCPHKTDSYNCLKDKCDTWKIFKKLMEG